ncbi:pilus assembly protein TadG-related protein [Raoultibacter phocaeensis]|uniref:pilus assembly protein TadG-related protein n=1 Tax=Raoultibacter phocaeensis TaxID=2479841 RepID=UPI0021064A0A|nr:pilus assembly protein TadG-related protein [Raoultibacter phocaeensis]
MKPVDCRWERCAWFGVVGAMLYKKVASAFERVGARRGKRGILYAEEGFSTVGMVLVLLLTLALIFTGAQVYQLESTSSQVQNVADATALAAENEVAEFFIVVRVVDAVVLSMSLTGLAAMGLGVVALCTPATASMGSSLIKMSSNIVDARNSFAERASSGLTKVQALLPFLCAANGASVAQANSDASKGLGYFGFALALPVECDPIEVGALDVADDLIEDVRENEEALREAAEKAEEAARKARAEKERAFMADCGSNPAYCMYERADHLAGLSQEDNPLYRSVDTWSFSVALKRAQAYYPARLASEGPGGSSVEEAARSALRERFYRYAASEVERGYVRETEDSFDALFPRMPKNTAEMRETELYTESVYPITAGAEGQTMHAWAGCPAVSRGQAGLGSIAQMEAGSYVSCAACGFTAASMGKVAAASTSIENGFEYHYNIVADAAEAYRKAREEGDPYAEEAKGRAQGLFDKVSAAIGDVASYRIHAEPPGRFGAVAFVADLSTVSVSDAFSSSFVRTEGSLGTRAALSAAALARDDPEEGASVISAVLDNVDEAGAGGALGALGIVLDLWSSLLAYYSQGVEALGKGVDDALSALPLVSESGLGLWASSALSRLLESLGLEPVDLDSPKPALVNSAHVLAADASRFSQTLLAAKQESIALGDAAGSDLFSTALSVFETSALDALGGLEGGIVIAVIEPFGSSGPSFPLTLALPPSAVSAAGQAVQDSIARMKSIYGQYGGMMRWE